MAIYMNVISNPSGYRYKCYHSTKPSWESHVNAIVAKANCHRPNNITFILLYYFDVK